MDQHSGPVILLVKLRVFTLTALPLETFFKTVTAVFQAAYRMLIALDEKTG